MLLRGVKGPLALSVAALGAVVHEPAIDSLGGGLTRSRRLPLAIATTIATTIATARAHATIVLAICLGLELGTGWIVGKVVGATTLVALAAILGSLLLGLRERQLLLDLGQL